MHATPSGTSDYAKKFSSYRDFYIKFDALTFSKISLGTYSPEPYWEDNYLYSFKDSVKVAIENGINLIDTASNYRYGESEKEVGSAIKDLIADGTIKRENVIITSKGGFIQLEYPFPENPYEWIEKNIVTPGFAKTSQIELDEHCMTPGFLEFSLNRSLKNLGLSTIDIYFLHNPEFEKIGKSEEEFYHCIKLAFEKFEEMVDMGKIRYYGIATWNGLLYTEDSQEFISLQRVVDIAREVGGKNHHFKYLQVPFNLAKTTALTLPNQPLADGKYYTLVDAAKKLDLGVMGSSSLLRMNLFKRQFKPEISYVLDPTTKLTTNIQLALQFVRSARGFISNAFGAKYDLHVKHNIEIANIKAVSTSMFNLLFKVQ